MPELKHTAHTRNAPHTCFTSRAPLEHRARSCQILKIGSGEPQGCAAFVDEGGAAWATATEEDGDL
eukprot:8266289-Alexandrium_andersonii.AAC.1